MIYIHRSNFDHDVAVGYCWTIESGRWSYLNSFAIGRSRACAVSMPNATYVFGGYPGENTSEILRHGSVNWEKGPDIPDGLIDGCGVKISDEELLLIGGDHTPNRIILLNTTSNEWHNTSITLQVARNGGHRCILFNEKVYVTGGFNTESFLGTTEIIDIRSDRFTVTLGGTMNEQRQYHGIGIIDIDNVPTLVVAAGFCPHACIDSIEAWDEKVKLWKNLPNLKTPTKRRMFAFVNVPTKLAC